MIKSPPQYEGKYTESFLKCLEKYKGIKKQIETLIPRILADPFINSHRLTKKGRVDLRGKRSRHFARNFVIIYMVCNECTRESFREKGYNECAFCSGEPLKRVIFLALGQHDDIYSREWRAKI